MKDAPRVLVVDDEQVVLDSIRKHLRREGYEIRTVLSAAEALEILDAEGADIVITDLMMPGMDGLELLARIMEKGERIPVIMITGYATMRTALQALRRGAFDYVSTPFTRSELQGVVARGARPGAGGGVGVGGAPTRDVAGPESLHHLGGHCWVQEMPGGAARVGLEREFAFTLGDLDALELPAVDDVLEQGSVCVRFLARDGRSHTLWSPITGRVSAVNEKVRERPSLAVSDPYGEGWILELVPRDLAADLAGLAPEA